MKKAFTLLELVMVILVIGILAAAIIPRTRTNPLAEASISLLAQIRYTQHLSLVNDKYDVNNSSSWFKNRWYIEFINNSYSIVSNTTYAINPLDKISKIQNIKLKGIESIILSNGCANQTIINFDYLGRPLIGDLSGTSKPYTAIGTAGQLLTTKCTIKLTNGSKEAYIDISPETGYLIIR